jgi:flavodoxin
MRTYIKNRNPFERYSFIRKNEKMKNKLTFLLSFLLLLSLSACAANQTPPAEVQQIPDIQETGTNQVISNTQAPTQKPTETIQPTEPVQPTEVTPTSNSSSRILIAYFSRAGENYNVGFIKKGNTQVIAELIVEKTGSDLFKIETTVQYPESYKETTDIAKREQAENARPKLSTHVDNMDQYDIILLGYPNWWGTMPMAVFTFLEEYDLSGKTIIPFCTHEGSGLGRSESDIASLVPDVTLREGLAIRGSNVNSEQAKQDVTNWLKKLGLIQ